jgi:hypothetical protein
MFYFADHALIQADTGVAYTTGSKSGYGDIGLCLKVRSPLNSSKVALVMAGAHTFGTHAAAVALCATKLLLPIADRFARGEFQLVVERLPAPPQVGESPGDPLVRILEPGGFEGVTAMNPRDVTDALRLLMAPRFANVAIASSASRRNRDLVLGAGGLFGGTGLLLIGLTVQTPYYAVMGCALSMIGILHLWGAGGKG